MEIPKVGNVKRSKNFKDSEVEILLNTVHKNKNILENKQTDQITQREKEKCWLQIEKEFNQVSGLYFRDWRTLKSKYDNIKKTSKRKWADERKYVLGTGGGPSKPSSLTVTDLKVKDILGDLPVLGNKSGFDSDAQLDLPVDPSVEDNSSIELSNFDFSNVPVIMEEEVESHHTYALKEAEAACTSYMYDPQSTSSGHFMVEQSPKKKSPPRVSPKNVPLFDSQFSVKKLKSRSSSPLKIRKKRASPLDQSAAGCKIELMVKAKTDLFELQKTLVQHQLKYEEEEHSMKMKFLKEEHIQKMKVMELKIKNQELKITKCTE